MHEQGMELRLEEIELASDSPLAGVSLGAAMVRDRTGALVLALRDHDGTFLTTPAAHTVMKAGQILIAIGTAAQLHALSVAAHRRAATVE
jgi:voltage-gated potassium channel